MVNQSKREYVTAILGRYQRAGRKFKHKILDEFCSICGYHRKHAIRLLRQRVAPRLDRRGAKVAIRAGGRSGAERHLVGFGSVVRETIEGRDSSLVAVLSPKTRITKRRLRPAFKGQSSNVGSPAKTGTPTVWRQGPVRHTSRNALPASDPYQNRYGGCQQARLCGGRYGGPLRQFIGWRLRLEPYADGHFQRLDRKPCRLE